MVTKGAASAAPIGPAMISELVPREHKCPPAQGDPVPGVECLFVHGPSVYHARRLRSEVDVDVLIGRVTPDLGVVLVETRKT